MNKMLEDWMRVRPSTTLLAVVRDIRERCERCVTLSFTVRVRSFRGVLGEKYNYRSVTVALHRLVGYGLIEQLPKTSATAVSRYQVVVKPFLEETNFI